MPAARCSDEEFVELYRTLGVHETARKLGVAERNVLQRRQRIERRTGVEVLGPKRSHLHVRVPAPQGSARIELDVREGTVLVASDAHYWPGEETLMHRALVRFARELKPCALVLNGDVMDFPAISRHARIGWEHRPQVVEEIEWAQDKLHELAQASGQARKIWTLGNHDCLDSETECLTRRGWLRHYQLCADDRVLARRPDGSVEWVSINEIVKFPYDGQLVRAEKTRMNIAITPNHRVLLKRLNWRTSKYDIEEFRRADDLPSSFDLPVSGTNTNGEFKEIPDAILSLIGWILTDGHMSTTETSIYQSKPESTKEIRNLLDSLGLDYSEYTRQRKPQDICGRAPKSIPLPATQFRLTNEETRFIQQWINEKGYLPYWVYELSERQFSILLTTLIAGDGVWDGVPSRKNCAVLYGTYEFLSSVQAAAVCFGWRARLAQDTRGDFRLCLAKQDKLRMERGEFYRENYRGTIWCLRVPHENFMVRRKGCTFFTGNSRFESRLANLAPEYAKLNGVHLKDHFSLWEPAWSVFINGEVLVKHRFRGGIHAVHNNLLWSGCHTVTGHLHSAQVRALTLYNERTVWGMDSGCLAEPSARAFQDYTEDNPKNWRSGFGVLTFRAGRLLQPELVLKWDEQHVQFRGELISC